MEMKITSNETMEAEDFYSATISNPVPYPPGIDFLELTAISWPHYMP